ncbi:MFS transporter [Clostridium sp. DL1XJH146]
MGVTYSAEKQRKVGFKNKIAYGIGDLYGGGSFLIIGMLYLIFLTDVAKLTPALAGLVIALGKIWDAVSDPLMGYISDHTQSKRGRRKVYFLLGIFPIFITFTLIWIPFRFSSQVTAFIYYLVAYLLFNTVFTMVMVPYNTIAAEMTNDYSTRSSMTGVRMAFSQISALIGALIPLRIVAAFPDSNKGYIVMAACFGLLFSLPWLLVYKGTWERKHEKIEAIQKKNFVKEIKDFYKTIGKALCNRSLKVHTGMYLSAYVPMDIFNALLIYYFTCYLKQPASNSSLFLGVVLLTQIASLYFVTKECSKRGNAKAYRFHTIVLAVGVIALGFATPNASNLRIYFNAILIGVGLVGCVMIPYNMLPFVTDADEIISTERREGIYAGLMTFVRKISQAAAIFLVGVCLDLLQYDSNLEVQSQFTISGIRVMLMTIPIIIVLIGFFISFKYKISPKNHEILLAEIERLKQGGKKSEVDKKVKDVCEEITGIEYKKLWGGSYANEDN